MTQFVEKGMMSLKLIQSCWHIGRIITVSSIGAIGLSMLTLPPIKSDAIASDLCPSPALSLVETHQVASGETMESIAATYGLLPVTLMAMNPTVANSSPSPGTILRIPPFNGVEVVVSEGQTWQDVATTYRARADVLFEVNGCPDSIPERIFVPGVSWLLDSSPSEEVAMPENVDNDPLSAYPLSQPGKVIQGYGWQTDPSTEQLIFSSGIKLASDLDAAVLSAGNGTIAYVGEELNLGTLIVINHTDGLQTRYGLVSNPVVTVGDQVTAGQELGATSLTEEDTTALYFEVRTNSDLGWVARNPGDYIPELAIR